MLQSCVFIFLSILAFDFDLIFVSYLTFWGPDGLFLGWTRGSSTVFGSTHIVEQISFSMFLSILTFDFDIVLESFCTLLSPNGLFWGWGRGRRLLWALIMYLNNLNFLCFFQF